MANTFSGSTDLPSGAAAVTTLLDLTQTERAPATARRLSEAALDFLGSLNESQCKAATLPFWRRPTLCVGLPSAGEHAA